MCLNKYLRAKNKKVLLFTMQESVIYLIILVCSMDKKYNFHSSWAELFFVIGTLSDWKEIKREESVENNKSFKFQLT